MKPKITPKWSHYHSADLQKQNSTHSKGPPKTQKKLFGKIDISPYKGPEMGTLSDTPIDNVQGTIYYATISIGSTGQESVVAFGTYFDELIIPNINCLECKGKSLYDHSKSTTYFENGELIHVACHQYGNFTGYLSRDQIQIGDITGRLTFTEAESVPEIINKYIFDGIWGLGFPHDRKASEGAISTIEQLFDDGTIAYPAFSFFFMGSPDPKSKLQSTLILGTPNPEYFTGNLQYHPIMGFDQQHWKVELYAIGGKNEYYLGRNMIAKFDTLEPFISVNSKLYGHLNVDAAWISPVPCKHIVNDREKFVSFVIGLKEYKLEMIDYILELGDGNCLSVIRQHESAENDIILGLTFMTKYYTLFDYKKKLIGLAPAKSFLNQ
jgi:hypothetical protein